jgi:hypothetical protein
MSFPFEFNTTLDTIPNSIPYLWADETLTSYWQERLGKTNQLKVGLTWAGNSLAKVDHRRSLQFSQLLPLLRVHGIELFSLQVGNASRQCKHLIDHTDKIRDFADTAALISQLDLVISVDTSVAHLAGAMGKRVWLLSRYDGSWHWLLDREDSPWYPSMRIFRQDQPGAWGGVIERVIAALNDLALSANIDKV